MEVSLELQSTVMEKLRVGIDAIRSHYNREITLPTVDYKLIGGNAGKAFCVKGHITLNGALLMQNGIQFIDRTVPHELAHIVCEVLYPEAHHPSSGNWGKIPKRKIHGPRFQEIMGVLGADGSRCHSYVIASNNKTKAKFVYECIVCGRDYVVGPKIHKQLMFGAGLGGCHCGGSLHLKISVGKVTYSEAREIVAGNIIPVVSEVNTKQLTVPSAGTKLYYCWVWYCNTVASNEVGDRWSRREVLLQFVHKFGCTVGGASTYYSTIKKLCEAGIV